MWLWSPTGPPPSLAEARALPIDRGPLSPPPSHFSPKGYFSIGENDDFSKKSIFIGRDSSFLENLVIPLARL